MFLPAYTPDELAFSFRCYVYFRWHTYRRQSLPALKQLTPQQFEAAHPEIHILELTASETEIALLASLHFTESVSTAASKLKGSASKAIRQVLGLGVPFRSLGGGYFAGTVGDNTSEQLDRYLERQGEHHGYDQQVRPPVWVQTWALTEADYAALQTAHAVTVLRWHLVISTWNHQGVFTRSAGQALCGCWERHNEDWRVRLQKVSVLPDHIHIAVWTHPTVVPGTLALQLLNTSQELIRDRYDGLLIEAGVPRLWKPGAYVGSYGDVTKAHVRNYLRKWESRDDQT
jgi:REP element-mobilizing transposase RayT